MGVGLSRRVTRLRPARPPAPCCSVQVRTDWACDYEADMAATFKANNQHCHVSGWMDSGGSILAA